MFKSPLTQLPAIQLKSQCCCAQVTSRFGSAAPTPNESHASPRPDAPRLAAASPRTPAGERFPKSTAASPSLAATARKPSATARATKRVEAAAVALPPHPSVVAMQEREQERLRRREEVSSSCFVVYRHLPLACVITYNHVSVAAAAAAASCRDRPCGGGGSCGS